MEKGVLRRERDQEREDVGVGVNLTTGPPDGTLASALMTTSHSMITITDFGGVGSFSSIQPDL